MFLGIYRFEGNPQELLAGYERMIQSVPAGNMQLHCCVPDAGGLWVVDTCPSRDVFEGFSSSPQFLDLLESVGLPAPSVQKIGDVHRLFVGGEQRI